MHLFEWVSCTHDITEATNGVWLLRVYDDNDEHSLHIVREKVPIALVNVVAELIKLIAYILTNFTIEINDYERPRQQAQRQEHFGWIFAAHCLWERIESM